MACNKTVHATKCCNMIGNNYYMKPGKPTVKIRPTKSGPDTGKPWTPKERKDIKYKQYKQEKKRWLK